jgi:3-methyl-2-oxobutanoate hydroxymethyltransferase
MAEQDQGKRAKIAELDLNFADTTQIHADGDCQPASIKGVNMSNSNSTASNEKAARQGRLTIRDIAKFKGQQPFAMITAYDQMSGKIFDRAGIPLLLVGDSAGNNFLGEENTIPVTVDEMIPLARAVVRASKRALVVADLPFGSYEASPEQALATAIRFFKEAQVQAVKIEGGERVVSQIKTLVEAGIPVMAHLGLTPQSVHALGGFRVQGRGEAGDALRRQAHAVAAAGAFALVLELVPAELAAQISSELNIPVIGIGAGNGTDGQVLVWTDLFGLTDNPPKFSRTYVNLQELMIAATVQWQNDVAAGEFPNEAESFH